MQTNSVQSAKRQQQRNFFVVLPVLIFPFVTFLLWSIGIIGPVSVQGQKITKEGLNSNLPGALPSKDSSWNKLKFYEEADKDSAKYKTLQRNDPNYSLPLVNHGDRPMLDTAKSQNQITKSATATYDPYSAHLQTERDPNEEKVYRKLSQLNAELKKTNQPSAFKNDDTITDIIQQPLVDPHASNFNNMQNLMQNDQATGNSSDPEMQQINGMLEKILDIQHPDRVTDKLKQQSASHKTQVYAVRKTDKNMQVSLLQGRFIDSANAIPISQNMFYSIDDKVADQTEETAISAIIPETKTLVTGATVKLQLTNEVYVNGVFIPKNEFIYGIASLEGERLTIKIQTIQYQNNILPVSLSVYDMDGLNGIYVPGAISRDVAKQSTEQAIQGIGLASLDPSVGAQAASAGIQAAKSLIGKKVKQIKVRVKAGYKILLKDENQKDNN